MRCLTNVRLPTSDIVAGTCNSQSTESGNKGPTDDEWREGQVGTDSRAICS